MIPLQNAELMTENGDRSLLTTSTPTRLIGGRFSRGDQGIEYLRFLQEKSVGQRVTLGLLDAWRGFFRAGGSIVVFQAQVGDQVFTAHPAQRVLEFHQLDEDIVLGVQALGDHR